MTDHLERRLTDAVLAVPGVTTLFATRPIRHAAVAGVAATLELPGPDLRVDVDRADGVTRVTAHIGVTDEATAPDTLRAVAAEVRSILVEAAIGEVAIDVSVRLIEDPVVS